MATYLQSLLGEDEFKKTQQGARNMGLLQAGLAGLMASGPSLTPTSAGQALGAAGLSGLSGYQDAMSEAERQGLQGIEFEQMQQSRQSDEAFKAALPEVFKDGKINYQAAQQLALAYPEKMGQVMSSLKSAQPPKAPTVDLQFDPKTGTIFNKQTGEITYAPGFEPGQVKVGGLIPDGATPEEKAAIYRREAERVAATDPKLAKDYYSLAESSLKGGQSNVKQLQDLPTGVQNQVNGVNGTLDAANSLITMLGDYSQFDVLNPKKQADIQAAMRNLQLQAKEAYNLGVLNGPDLELLNEVIVQPYSARGMMIGQEGIIDSIKKFQKLIENRGTSVIKPYVGEENIKNFIDLNKISKKTDTNNNDLQAQARAERERRKRGQ